MPRMIDLIRASAVPSNIVQSAAKGSLAMPGAEMVEILVYLATDSEVFGEQARMTLAGWDENASQAIAADPKTPLEILDYMISPQNLRPPLLPSLIGNSSITDASLVALGAVGLRDSVEIMLKSERVNESKEILTALASNPNLSGIQSEFVKNKIAPPAPENTENAGASVDDEQVLEQEINTYIKENAQEIEGNEKPFQPIGGIYELPHSEEPVEAVAAAAGGAAVAAQKAKDPAVRGSALQKISNLDVKGRIQLAMKGNKEERAILVRDGTKVVALGVLESPKLTDAEVEKFAAQKNVLESLLRGISMKRRFMKNYNVVRNLVANPRTPMDLSLSLMKNLLINDLKNISGNKDVPDTIRKLAQKMYRQKKNPSKKDV